MRLDSYREKEQKLNHNLCAGGKEINWYLDERKLEGSYWGGNRLLIQDTTF